ncbi:hypothetical protein BDN72DRAFT_902209 [Pluteus cervinus]|uniref:Uncharacterized protein n=1 Tax=Pluteus cervinus TaxID=181527 RepID=A0ACD3ADF3_9AGAR|nr:hypothetical protein BDN72DRAFT_902209 [Pluteus cervinus]
MSKTLQLQQVVDMEQPNMFPNDGLDASSLRLGQLTGGRSNERGAWATTDWAPILVRSSITLGALPSAPGVIS